MPPETRTCVKMERPGSKQREPVVLLTCQFFLPLHPSDGGSWLAADGCTGELHLISLADLILAALYDWATWGD